MCFDPSNLSTIPISLFQIFLYSPYIFLLFITPMNFQNTKTQELLCSLENLENCYNPSSPYYKFSRVFYNVVDHPISKPLDFPQDLWTKYFIPDAPLMPVILNKNQIEERKQLQNELIAKLSESKPGLLKKIENLKIKKESVKNKLQNVVEKFRSKTKKYVFCEPGTALPKIYTDILEREKFIVNNNKEEVLDYLQKMNERLLQFEKRVGESLHMIEKKSTLARQMNRF